MALIEQEALIQAIENLRGNCDSRFYDEAIIDCVSEVVSAPTIDPIRAAGGCYCRECSFDRKPHAEDMQDGYVYCQEQSKYKSVDDFCSGGEPQEAQDDG